MRKVLTNFSSTTWSELTSQSLEVETKMPLNIAFKNPLIPIADLTTARVNVENAAAAAKDGGKSLTIAKHAAMGILAVLLTRQALWVNAVCSGNVTMLTASGYKLQQVPQPASIPTAPESLIALATGYTGEVKLKFKGAKGATGFQVVVSTTDPAVGATWVPATVTTKRAATVGNLESNKNYWFAIVAIGTKGESLMSATAVAKAA